MAFDYCAMAFKEGGIIFNERGMAFNDRPIENRKVIEPLEASAFFVVLKSARLGKSGRLGRAVRRL